MEHEPNRSQEGQSRLPDLKKLEMITFGLQSNQNYQYSQAMIASARFLYGEPSLNQRQIYLLEYNPSGKMVFILIRVSFFLLVRRTSLLP